MSTTFELADVISPFSALGGEDVERIQASQVFQEQLKFSTGREERFRLCSSTRHGVLDLESTATWHSHHAILLLLMQPLLGVFKDACAAASTAVCTRRAEEWELAFRGDARGAFVWLQCLAGEEKEWLRMREGGCFVCQVQHTLSSESTIRAVMTAVLLSESTSSLPSEVQANKGLPDLSPLLPALRLSLEADSFWGPYQYDHLLSRAEKFNQAMRHLVQQTSELAASTSSTVRPSLPTPQAHTLHPHHVHLASHHHHHPCRMHVISGPVRPQRPAALSLIKLRPSGMAQRQLQLKEEEMTIMAELLQKWIRDEERKLGEGKGSGKTVPATRRRSLSLPRRRILTARRG